MTNMSQVFQHKHRVSYSECTLGNHVYYARYLDILEEARGELFRSRAVPLLQLQEQDTIFPVIECRVRYKGQARYDDELTVEVSVIAAEGIRLNFGYRVLNAAGELILQGETHHVCATAGNRPKRLPATLVEKLGCWLTTPCSGPGQ
jgi:acyl-CoA thioester hydrolase